MAEIVCVQCKAVGKPKKIKRGSTRAEAMGWMMFPLGIPYTLWRMFSKRPACRYCGSEMILAAESLAGQKLVKIAAGEDIPTMPTLRSTHKLSLPETPSMTELPASLETRPRIVLEAPAELKPLAEPEPRKKAPPDPNVW